MYKIQLTLTPEEASILNSEASLLGYSLTKYIKALISLKVVNTVEQGIIPTYRMSKKGERVATESLEEYKMGKTVKLNSLDQLDDL